MCSVTAVGLGIVSSAFSGFSAYKQQQAQNQANEYNAQVAEQNAANLEVSAKQVEAKGVTEEIQIGQKTESTLAKQRVAFAAGGVTVGKGSGETLALETAKQGAIDLMTARFNTAAEAENLRRQAVSQEKQASMYRASKSSAKAAGVLGVLGGATNLASTFAINKAFK